MPLLIALLLAGGGAPIDPVTFAEGYESDQFRETVLPSCREQPQCFDMQFYAFLNVRGSLQAADAKKRALIEREIIADTHDGFTNWQVVATLYPPPPPETHQPIEPALPRSAVSCSTSVSKHGRHIRSFCY